MKYSVGQKVKIRSLEWYRDNVNRYGIIECGKYEFFEPMNEYCGKVVTIKRIDDDNYRIDTDKGAFCWTDEMIEGLMEDETPKFKVNDIVFVKNIGWIRITNSYWDFLANEYIYEAIGFNGEGEYDYINESNIECQMLPESENPHTGGNKITLEEYKNNDKEWLFNKLAMLDNITALESIQDIFNHLQRYKYPKTYEECCKLLGIDEYDLVQDYRVGKIRNIQSERIERLNILNKLLICRDAYWKIAGEEMGLGKPWQPSGNEDCFVISRSCGDVFLYAGPGDSEPFEFPTPEMRNTFKNNFDPDIEFCKELL